ncbi:hypothetical protein [Nostoc sp.]
MTANKKLQSQGDGVFGHGEWGTCTERCRSMEHSEEVANAQCPKRRGGYPSPPTLGMEFLADFNESRLTS